MNEVRMDKSVLLAAMEANLDTHMEAYETALAGWKADYQAQLQAACQDLANWDGKTVFQMEERRPKSYESDYTTMISMIENDVRGDIELTPQQFKEYVLNEWAWSANFNFSNSKYLG